jgi:hypothetical protein
MRSDSRPLPPRMRHRLDFVLLKRDIGYSFNWRLDRETDRDSVVRGWGMKAICLRARGEAWTLVLAVMLHARETKSLVVPEPPKKGE